jgi:hypothetical protein
MVQFLHIQIFQLEFKSMNLVERRNMNITRFVFFICVIALVVPCYAEKVVVDYNKEFNFSSIKTYAWTKGTPADPLMEQRIVSAVESQLAKHGLQKSDSVPDVFIVTHAMTREDISLREWGDGPLPWSRGTIDINKILAGTLVVDILDSKDKQLVWRGIADGTLSDKPEKVEAKIKKVTEKMFQKFPNVSGRE